MEYSAGIISKLLWFIETRETAKLLQNHPYVFICNDRRTLMEFQERLDSIWKRISDEEFLANRGVANEVRYYVFA